MCSHIFYETEGLKFLAGKVDTTGIAGSWARLQAGVTPSLPLTIGG
jgi:hypothetical protein